MERDLAIISKLMDILAGKTQFPFTIGESKYNSIDDIIEIKDKLGESRYYSSSGEIKNTVISSFTPWHLETTTSANITRYTNSQTVNEVNKKELTLDQKIVQYIYSYSIRVIKSVSDVRVVSKLGDSIFMDLHGYILYYKNTLEKELPLEIFIAYLVMYANRGKSVGTSDRFDKNVDILRDTTSRPTISYFDIGLGIVNDGLTKDLVVDYDALFTAHHILDFMTIYDDNTVSESKCYVNLKLFNRLSISKINARLHGVDTASNIAVVASRLKYQFASHAAGLTVFTDSTDITSNHRMRILFGTFLSDITLYDRPYDLVVDSISKTSKLNEIGCISKNEKDRLIRDLFGIAPDSEVPLHIHDVSYFNLVSVVNKFMINRIATIPNRSMFYDYDLGELGKRFANINIDYVSAESAELTYTNVLIKATLVNSIDRTNSYISEAENLALNKVFDSEKPILNYHNILKLTYENAGFLEKCADKLAMNVGTTSISEILIYILRGLHHGVSRENIMNNFLSKSSLKYMHAINQTRGLTCDRSLGLSDSIYIPINMADICILTHGYFRYITYCKKYTSESIHAMMSFEVASELIDPIRGKRVTALKSREAFILACADMIGRNISPSRIASLLGSFKAILENFTLEDVANADSNKLDDIMKVISNIGAKRKLAEEYPGYEEEIDNPKPKEITVVPYEDDTYRIYLLDHDDTTGIMVGESEYSNCCQYVGGAASDCVLEGWVNPRSGFLVIEENGKFLAQSWVHLSDSGKILCLDSVESKYPGRCNKATRALVAWADMQEYQIHIGSLYTKLDREVLLELGYKEIHSCDSDYSFDDMIEMEAEPEMDDTDANAGHSTLRFIPDQAMPDDDGRAYLNLYENNAINDYEVTVNVFSDIEALRFTPVSNTVRGIYTDSDSRRYIKNN